MRRILPAVLLLMAMLACIWLSASALGRTYNPSPAVGAGSTLTPTATGMSSSTDPAAPIDPALPGGPAAGLPEVAGPPATLEDGEPAEAQEQFA